MVLIINTILSLQFYGVIILRLAKLNCLNQDVFTSIKLERFIVLLYVVVISD